MTQDQANRAAPLVSVLVGAFHGRRYLRRALRSLLGQTYPNLQVIVINPTLEGVSDIVAGWPGSGTALVEGRDIPGKAAALNRGLQRAEGKYVAYLDDTALFRPSHIARLVKALEGATDCQVAYSDFYVTYCQPGPDGTHQALAKYAEISRDFDRLFLCHFNHVLRVSMMHRRDLLAATGPCDERIRLLVDWDMTRRMAFFTDFIHVHDITAEIHVLLAGAGDAAVPDAEEYLKEVLTIRTARPAKPWPRMPDLSIIFAPSHADENVRQALRDIWQWTFVPYEVYLPLPPEQLQRLRTPMPALVRVPVETDLPTARRVDQALQRCQGDYVAVVPEGVPIRPMWVEPAVEALRSSPAADLGIKLGRNGESPWAAVLQTGQLRAARRNHPHLTVQQSVDAERITVRPPRPAELPFQFDTSLAQGQLQEGEGNWLRAAEMYQRM